MRYAIISDVHANLEALQSTLMKISSLGADRIICLGDVVGYNPNPNECVEIMRNEGVTCIMGNHDACACGLEEPDHFNPAARRAVIWTREQLTKKNMKFLRDLPRELHIDDFFIFHGSIHDTDRYIMHQSDVVDNFRLLQRLLHAPRTGFYGHTHVKTAFSLHRGSISLDLSDELQLTGSKMHLINPGAVGQPRDFDPRAAFLLYDADANKASFYRVEYDILKTQDKIVKAGLPAWLAERLSLGR